MKIVGFVGTLLGSSVGWWIGSAGGTMTAFFASTIAGGLGLYYGRRIGARFLG